MDKDGLIYLASPYSHESPAIQKKRFLDVCNAAAWFMGKGFNIFSPIAHSHPIAQYGLPTGWQFWKSYDELMMYKCDGMIVLMLDGWEESEGVQDEIQYMKDHKKPIEYWRCINGTYQKETVLWNSR